MIKKYEVEQLIENALLELDGIIDDKPKDNNEHDMYFVSTEKTSDGIIANFETWINCDPNDVEKDKYQITVKYVTDDKSKEQLILELVKEVFEQYVHKLGFDKCDENWEVRCTG